MGCKIKKKKKSTFYGVTQGLFKCLEEIQMKNKEVRFCY